MIAFLIILAVLLTALEVLSLRGAFLHLSYRVETDKRSVDPGEHFLIRSLLQNRSCLPAPFLQVREKLPGCIGVELAEGARYTLSLPADFSRGAARLDSRVYLLPRQQLKRTVTASLPHRGRFFFSGADVYGGDFLGLSDLLTTFECYCEVVVLPKRAEDTAALAALGGFLGERSVRRFIMEDPVLTLGCRAYTGSEPMKQIAWKQSARTGMLMVKEYDHTLEPSASVVLNIDCHAENAAERIERCYSLARTVCETLEKERIPYGFYTNAMAASAVGCWKGVPEGLSPAHLTAILEGLGRATYTAAETFAAVVERAARAATAGRSHILITPQHGAEAEGQRRILQEKTGGTVTLLTADAPGTGERAAEQEGA